MTTDYVPKEIFSRILEALTPQNALVLELCMGSGMRISDALSMTYDEAMGMLCSGSTRYHYTEKKTGKERDASVPSDWLCRALDQYNPKSDWLFAGRDPQKHRTRQAVWKDLHRAAKLYRVNGQRLRARIGPHTARKIYAVGLYHEAAENGSEDPLGAVMDDLNHSDPAVTSVYALADVISARKRDLRQKNRS